MALSSQQTCLVPLICFLVCFVGIQSDESSDNSVISRCKMSWQKSVFTFHLRIQIEKKCLKYIWSSKILWLSDSLENLECSLSFCLYMISIYIQLYVLWNTTGCLASIFIKTVWTDINAQNVLLPINTAPTQTNSVLAVSSFVLNAKGF